MVKLFKNTLYVIFLLDGQCLSFTSHPYHYFIHKLCAPPTVRRGFGVKLKCPYLSPYFSCFISWMIKLNNLYALICDLS